MASMLTSSVALRRLSCVRLKASGRIASSPRRISAQAGELVSSAQKVVRALRLIFESYRSLLKLSTIRVHRFTRDIRSRCDRREGS